MRLGANHAPTLSSSAENFSENHPPSSSSIDGATVTPKAVVFSIFDKKHVETRWTCGTCTLLNTGRQICAACGSSCPKPKTANSVSLIDDCKVSARTVESCVAFAGSFAVSKNTQRVYVFSDSRGVNLIGTITQSQLDDNEASSLFPPDIFRVVSGFFSDFFALRAIQQRQLSDRRAPRNQ